MHPSKRLVLIVSIAAGLLVVGATVYAVGPINIIFKTSPDGIKSIEVMRITSNGTVGIGTVNPKSKLDVNGGIAIGGNLQGSIYKTNIPQANTATNVDSGGVGSFTSITIGTDGLPVVSYHDDTNNALKILHCGNVACNSGDTATTVDSGGVGIFTSITIGSDGFPVVSYIGHVNCFFNQCFNSDLKILHCGNVLCSSGNTNSSADGGAGAPGSGTSITIGTDGLPVVSYFGDGANPELGVFHCRNVSCTTGNITLPDTSVLGADDSITIGTDGLPVISFHDTNNDLRIVHCGNAGCTSGITVSVVDSGGVGAFTSITIGTDGLPIVSYRDNTNGTLKILHSGSILGISNWIRR